jgi:hypothetical protein
VQEKKFFLRIEIVRKKTDRFYVFIGKTKVFLVNFTKTERRNIWPVELAVLWEPSASENFAL